MNNDTSKRENKDYQSPPILAPTVSDLSEYCESCVARSNYSTSAQDAARLVSQARTRVVSRRRVKMPSKGSRGSALVVKALARFALGLNVCSRHVSLMGTSQVEEYNFMKKDQSRI
jgi:hypothetical protein